MRLHWQCASKGFSTRPGFPSLSHPRTLPMHHLVSSQLPRCELPVRRQQQQPTGYISINIEKRAITIRICTTNVLTLWNVQLPSCNYSATRFRRHILVELDQFGQCEFNWFIRRPTWNYMEGNVDVLQIISGQREREREREGGDKVDWMYMRWRRLFQQ